MELSFRFLDLELYFSFGRPEAHDHDIYVESTSATSDTAISLSPTGFGGYWEDEE